MLACRWEVTALVRGDVILAEGARTLSLDLTDKAAFAQLPESMDVIVHLAQSLAYRSFPDGMRDMMAVNVQGTFELLEYARASGCQQFVYAATGSVYEGQGDQSEDGRLNPQSAYAVSKYCAELLLRPYSDLFGTLALRLFFLYGPGQQAMMMPGLIQRLCKGEPVSLHGSGGGMLFCPTFVDDVASVMRVAIEKRIAGVSNVASPELLSLRDAVRILADGLGVEPSFTNTPDASVPEFRPSLRSLAGWYDLEQGFRSFAQGVAETLRT